MALEAKRNWKVLRDIIPEPMENSALKNAPKTSADQVTRLLDEAALGRKQAMQELFPLVYEELRKMAGQRMAVERPDHTLEPTALVHEAYLRLVGDTELHWQNRAHFFYAAAEAMRRILIEHARAKGRQKRGKGRPALRSLEGVADLAAQRDIDEILAVDDAVRRLEAQNPEVGRVVRFRFYAGLSTEDTAKATGLSPRTVYRQWAYARAWLYRELESQPRVVQGHETPPA